MSEDNSISRAGSVLTEEWYREQKRQDRNTIDSLRQQLAAEKERAGKMESDCRTLAAECEVWRDECGRKTRDGWQSVHGDDDGTSYYSHDEADATDASGALTRWTLTPGEEP